MGDLEAGIFLRESLTPPLLFCREKRGELINGVNFEYRARRNTYVSYGLVIEFAHFPVFWRIL